MTFLSSIQIPSQQKPSAAAGVKISCRAEIGPGGAMSDGGEERIDPVIISTKPTSEARLEVRNRREEEGWRGRTP